MNKPYAIKITKTVDVKRTKPYVVIIEITVTDSLFLDRLINVIKEGSYGLWYETYEHWGTRIFLKDKFALHVYMRRGGKVWLLDCFKENRQEERELQPFSFSSREKQNVYSTKAYELLSTFMLNQYDEYRELVAIAEKISKNIQLRRRNEYEHV
ncbi:hypothetical protein OM416_19970 [Paenibacillus sp. LS1]|uniref:hypothetical protein n=1 Tax=Paenibacillus sp. LS1 TaxID=2992120 RepID=UPI0022318099|nr:hypothetical protein [Paenibacillus sp. LS1]MCW3793873.1 hypothetical protein [Paenibacillus sp. LS1]